MSTQMIIIIKSRNKSNAWETVTIGVDELRRSCCYGNKCRSPMIPAVILNFATLVFLLFLSFSVTKTLNCWSAGKNKKQNKNPARY